MRSPELISRVKWNKREAQERQVHLYTYDKTRKATVFHLTLFRRNQPVFLKSDRVRLRAKWDNHHLQITTIFPIVQYIRCRTLTFKRVLIRESIKVNSPV